MNTGMYTRNTGPYFITIYPDKTGWNWETFNQYNGDMDEDGRWSFRIRGDWSFKEHVHEGYLDKFFAPFILVRW